MPLLENLSSTILILRFFILCCIASLPLTAVFVYIQKRNKSHDYKQHPGIFVCQNLQQAKSILDGSCFEKQNMFAILQSRAEPNIRLIRAFGIDNAFTTTDTKYHQEFVNRAAALLNLNSARWESLARKIDTLVKGNIQRQRASSPDGMVLLSPLLQITVLRAIMSILFPTYDASYLSEEEQDCIAYEIADKINSLWIKSKTTDHTNPEDLESLKKACQKLLPGMAMDSPLDNPLNLILPAFETLWRIALRCFIEVQFRDKDNLAYSTSLLRAYLTAPTSENFTKEDAQGVSVSHIVSESLRLYPPTKRIHRQIQPGSSVRPDVAIDIEQIHHDAEIWGSDATRFRPSRWRKAEMKKNAVAAFIPFGMKPLVCPARRVFGPRVIGIIVASLSAAFEGVGELDIFGETIRRGVLLENERDSYRSMGIRLS